MRPLVAFPAVQQETQSLQGVSLRFGVPIPQMGSAMVQPWRLDYELRDTHGSPCCMRKAQASSSSRT